MKNSTCPECGYYPTHHVWRWLGGEGDVLRLECIKCDWAAAPEDPPRISLLEKEEIK